VPGLEVTLLAGLLIARILWSRTLRDVLAGVILRFERRLAPGEKIVAGGLSGVVEEVGVRSVTLRADGESLVTIPCGVLLSNPIANLSRGEAGAPVSARVRIPLAADARRVRELLLSVAGGVPGLAREPAPEAYVGEIGGGYAELALSGRAAPSAKATTVETELRLGVLEALATSGIPAVRSEHDIHLRDLDLVKAAIARAIEARQRERATTDDPGGIGNPGDPS
jgi:small-conductance mechanosensitive channel